MDSKGYAVGTLILLITTLFAASLTAAIVLKTETEFSGQTSGAATQAARTTRTSLVVLRSSGTSGLTALENFTFVIKLGASATPIMLADVAVVFRTEGASATYYYSGDETFSHASSTYGVSYLHESPGHADGELHPSETIEIQVQAPQPLLPRQEALVQFVQANGVTTTHTFEAPSTARSAAVHLFP